MIIGAAVCPHPPLLLRELSGSQDVAAELRRSCETALSSLIASAPDAIVVVGGAQESREHTAGQVPVRAFGGVGERKEPGSALPLSLGVGRRLLDDSAFGGQVEMVAVAWDASSGEIERLAQDLADRTERIGLLVMGDGSACRSERAPGHLDERAFDVDKHIGRALAEGDPESLLRVNPVLAGELLVAGRAAFQVLGAAVRASGASVRAETFYADDPFGVMYFVAGWACDFS